MKPEALLQAYRQMPKDMGLPDMEIGRVSWECQRLASRPAVLAKIQGFQPDAAWIGFQDTNIFIDGGGVGESYPDTHGEVLSAECWNGKTRQSLHIRHDGHPEGAWLATCFQAGEGGDYLADGFALIATEKTLGKLKYRRYWKIDPERGAEVFLACFVGFGKSV